MNYLAVASGIFQAISFARTGNTPVRNIKNQCDQIAFRERAAVLQTAIRMLNESKKGNITLQRVIY